MTPGKGLRGGFCHQVLVLEHQLLTRFDAIGIARNALDGTDLDALGYVEMAHALRAQVRVDLVIHLAERDGLVRAHGFADVAVDAGVEDDQGHSRHFTPKSEEPRVSLVGAASAAIASLPHPQSPAQPAP